MYKQNLMTIVLGILLNFSFPHVLMAKPQFSPKVVSKIKKGVVSIHGSASMTGYDNVGTWSGTGFLLHKEKGLICTNAHVIGRTTLGHYYLVFHNGHQVDAKVLYTDPWLDFAILKIDPAQIPQDVAQIKLNSAFPKENEKIFIVGNNEGQRFSIHEGNIASMYRIVGRLPQHTFNMSLNTTGGSSGSPVVNKKGEAIALNFGGSETYALSLPAAYIEHALRALLKHKHPTRKHIGAIFSNYSLSKGERHRGFPKKNVLEFMKKFPHSGAEAMQVVRVLKGSPAEKKLQVGDIIWKVNGKMVGPSLLDFDMAMNKTVGPKVSLHLFRAGHWVDVEVDLYDLEAHRIQRMVSFYGLLFFEMDDNWSHVTGQPARALSCASNFQDNAFGQKGTQFYVSLTGCDNQPVKNLNDLIKVIPKLIKKKTFSIDIIDCNSNFTCADSPCKIDIQYDKLMQEPKVFTFNKSKLEWIGKPIPLSTKSK